MTNITDKLEFQYWGVYLNIFIRIAELLLGIIFLGAGINNLQVRSTCFSCFGEYYRQYISMSSFCRLRVASFSHFSRVTRRGISMVLS
ncbi:hypothetical protein [Psychrobacillus sp. OK032]|uniref:hypothetical protein n=1 Tax=Psychrobacillus sp. OK032 TaxID=1884358 RepID=UPI0011601C47|nr:hypothetical protein [Psychrobacillus sp. OK032]